MTPLWWGPEDDDSGDDSSSSDSSSDSSSGSSMAETNQWGLDQLSVKAEPGSELGDKLDDDLASCSSAPHPALVPAGDSQLAVALPATSCALASPPPVQSPTGGRYNLRPRRSLSSSLDATPPVRSPAQRQGRGSGRSPTALPLAVIRGTAVLSSDEE